MTTDEFISAINIVYDRTINSFNQVAQSDEDMLHCMRGLAIVLEESADDLEDEMEDNND